MRKDSILANYYYSKLPLDKYTTGGPGKGGRGSLACPGPVCGPGGGGGGLHLGEGLKNLFQGIGEGIGGLFGSIGAGKRRMRKINEICNRAGMVYDPISRQCRPTEENKQRTYTFGPWTTTSKESYESMVEQDKIRRRLYELDRNTPPSYYTAPTPPSVGQSLPTIPNNDVTWNYTSPEGNIPQNLTGEQPYYGVPTGITSNAASTAKYGGALKKFQYAGLVSPRGLARQNVSSSTDAQMLAKMQADAQAADLYRRMKSAAKESSVGPARASTAYGERMRQVKNQTYAAQNAPYVNRDAQGNLSRAFPAVSMTGIPDPRSREERFQKGLQHIGRGLEAAGAIQGLGALGKVGYDATGQALAESMKSGLLSNTYKINPFAFKPNLEAYYRGIGKEGLKDALESGMLRVNQNPKWVSALTGKVPDVTTSSPYFFKGKDFKEVLQYEPNVIAEVVNQRMRERAFTRLANSLSDTPIPSVYQPTIKVGNIGKFDVVDNLSGVPLNKNVRILQKDWLRGYKPIDISRKDIITSSITRGPIPPPYSGTAINVGELGTGESIVGKEVDPAIAPYIGRVEPEYSPAEKVWRSWFKGTPPPYNPKQSGLFGDFRQMITKPNQYFRKPGTWGYDPMEEKISQEWWRNRGNIDPFGETGPIPIPRYTPGELDWNKIGQTAAGIGIGSGLGSAAISIGNKKHGGLVKAQDGKEITYIHKPSKDDAYMLKRTQTPYTSNRDIKRFTKMPTDPRDINFISNYKGAIGEVSEYPTSVPFEGKKHWNIDRFIIDPQFSEFKYEDVLSSPIGVPTTTKDQARKNVLADMYKYYMLQDPDHKGRAFRQAKRFVRKEIDPRVSGPFYDYNRNIKHYSLDTFADQNRLTDLYIEEQVGGDKATPEKVNALKNATLDYFKNYRKMSNREAKTLLNKWVEDANYTKETGNIRWAKGGPIRDDRGQLAHPGEITEISSPNITMEGVPYDVLGIGADGQQIMMKPGGSYRFNKAPVTEIPIAQTGTQVPPIYTSNPNDPRLRAYQDSLKLYNKYWNQVKEAANYYETSPTDILKSNQNSRRSFGSKQYIENDDYIKKYRKEKNHSTIKPTAIYDPGEYEFSGLKEYKKPVQPVEYREEPIKFEKLLTDRKPSMGLIGREFPQTQQQLLQNLPYRVEYRGEHGRPTSEYFENEAAIKEFWNATPGEKTGYYDRKEYGGPLVEYYKGRMTGPNIFQDGGGLTPYEGVSVVDFLAKQNKPTDYGSRKKLAESLGIKGYTGRPEENINLINLIKQNPGAIGFSQPVATQQPIQQQPVEQKPAMSFDYTNKVGKYIMPKREEPLLPIPPSDSFTAASQPISQPAIAIQQQKQPPTSISDSVSQLLSRQAFKESGFRPGVVNRKGYKGLVQLGKAAIEDYKRLTGDLDVNPLDPIHAVKVQKFLMNNLLNAKFINTPNQSDIVRQAKALASYNWGRGNVSKYLEKLKGAGTDIYNSLEWVHNLPKETKDYINKILLSEDPEFNKQYEAALVHPKNQQIRKLYGLKKGGQTNEGYYNYNYGVPEFKYGAPTEMNEFGYLVDKKAGGGEWHHGYYDEQGGPVDLTPPRSRAIVNKYGGDISIPKLPDLQGPLLQYYYSKGGGLTPNKAREILHDKEVHGHPLTEKQRRFFGAMSKGNTKKY